MSLGPPEIKSPCAKGIVQTSYKLNVRVMEDQQGHEVIGRGGNGLVIAQQVSGRTDAGTLAL